MDYNDILFSNSISENYKECFIMNTLDWVSYLGFLDFPTWFLDKYILNAVVPKLFAFRMNGILDIALY